MQALISEHFERGGECRGRSLHRTLILGHLGLDAATAAVGYENSVIAYLQKLLIPWNRQKLYQRLYLLERAFPLQTFLEELEVELDTRSMDELTRIDAIPVVIRNEDLLSEHFGVRSTKVIAAKLVMSAYGPVAISFQIARRRILIDIVELSRPDAEHLSEMKKEVSWAITRYRVDIVKECRVIDVDSWDLGRVPELFYSYAVSDPGTERLVSLSLDQIRERGPATFLALGEGTGIIGLAVARNSNARVVYADHKKGALVNAAIAVTAVGLSERLMVKESLLFDNLIGKRFDVIVYDVVNGQSAKTSIIPQSVRLLEDLLTQFADHLTADGVLFLRIPGNNQQAARLIQEFSERQLLQYEEIAGEGVKIHAIRIHPEKRDLPVVGPLKLIGGEMSPDTISLLHKREIRKLGWRQQAAAVAAERYSRDVKVILGDDERTERIELLIKHIQVTDLPPEVAVAYFWEEWEDGERCLVIISRRPFADEIRDEVIFYGYMHAKWTNIFIADHPKGETELTSDEREEIRQQAHVLAASQQAHVFRKTNYARIKGPDGYARHQAVFGVSKLHEQQLRQMDLNQLGTIISEFNLGSDGHRRLRESYFRARFMRAIEEYERNVKRYAIRRGLQLIFENKKGLLAVSRPRGKVKEVYFDMYGTLDYLEAHELRFLFGLLKETYGEQLKINIVSDAGTPKNPYRVLERSGVLEYVDTIVCTRSKPGTDCSDLLGVNVVLRGSITKIAHIREVCRQKLRSGEYDKDDRVLFFDDGGDNFGSEDSGESRIIQVGVIGRNNSDPEFRSLIYGDGRQIGAVNYYVGSLHNLDTIRQLLALIEPEAIPVARLTAAGMAMRELEAEEALATSL